MNFAKKSQLVSFLLTLFFGPLGLFYTTPLWALFLIVGALVFSWTVFIPVVIWIGSIILGFIYVADHNHQVNRYVTNTATKHSKDDYNQATPVQDKGYFVIDKGGNKSLVHIMKDEHEYIFETERGEELKLPHAPSSISFKDIKAKLIEDYPEIRFFSSIESAETYLIGGK